MAPSSKEGHVGFHPIDAGSNPVGASKFMDLEARPTLGEEGTFNPPPSSSILPGSSRNSNYALVAQWTEQEVSTLRVVGSNPTGSTKNNSRHLI